ncbi:hypothetical protein Cni_G02819 [Canna indica]|uniref:Uncharacterized protein n=1 Tax=Canna indica TaxID=4628 RepID=A0AAQ3Q312_9LILI|nr:hypothetical protein Cni_G02819 [Canna indica]
MNMDLIDLNLSVCSLIDDNGWNMNFINLMFGSCLVDFICRINLSIYPDEDKWIWNNNNTDFASSKSVYNFLGRNNNIEICNPPQWSLIWKSNVDPRIKNFI